MNELNSILLESDHLLTIQEISNFLSTPIPTIRSWMYRGEIPYVKFGNGKRSIVRFNPRLINDWIEGNQKLSKRKGGCIREDISIENSRMAKRETIKEFDDFSKSLKNLSVK